MLMLCTCIRVLFMFYLYFVDSICLHVMKWLMFAKNIIIITLLVRNQKEHLEYATFSLFPVLSLRHVIISRVRTVVG